MKNKENKEKEEARVFIQEAPEKITIQSENSDIRRLTLVSLRYDAEKNRL